MQLHLQQQYLHNVDLYTVALHDTQHSRRTIFAPDITVDSVMSNSILKGLKNNLFQLTCTFANSHLVIKILCMTNITL